MYGLTFGARLVALLIAATPAACVYSTDTPRPPLSTGNTALMAPDSNGQVASQSASPDRHTFIDKYCTECHNVADWAGGVAFDVLQSEDMRADAAGWDPELWEKVAHRVAAGEMPAPRAKQRPTPQEAHAFAGALTDELDAAARQKPYAGASVIRRLNRTEYANAVRDLLAVDFPFASELPPDGIAAGFDNIGDALSMSPVLLESYLRVGRKVSELALGISDNVPVAERFRPTHSQAQWIDGAPFGTRGGMVIHKFIAREGEYELRAFLNDETLTPIEGVRLFRTRVRIKPGLHTFVPTFPDYYADQEGPVPALGGPGGAGPGGPLDVKGSAWRPTISFLLDGKKLEEFKIGGASAAEASFNQGWGGPPALTYAEIEGPYDPGPVLRFASRDRIFVCMPKQVAEENACAAKILEHVTRRAFRHEITAEDLQPILATYLRARADRNFDGAIAAAITHVLIAPDFLFRLEFDPRGLPPGEIHPVSDSELASRLSFFLWSSIPDDALLQAARNGELRSKAGLKREVRRMLADRRADSLIDNFAAQWLGLRQIAEAQPDPIAYPEFDPALRDAFEQETRLFLTSIMRENRSVLDIIGGKYTYLNERLATHYGIPGVKGPGFRRVQFATDSPRSGVLGQGSILMATSHADKTSPVLRGKWVLDSLLNSPPLPPPAGVPPLNLAPDNDGRTLTTRELVERHRANPVCASCHSRMDPFGFALENFDVLGRWREKDGGGPIDARAELPQGQSFIGPSGLKDLLLAQPELFVAATVSRMMTYALGRPVTGRDQPEVRQIVQGTRQGGYQFFDIVFGIVNSTQFQYRETSKP